LEEAESLCRHIAIINEGEVIENTSMKQLLEKSAEESFVLGLEQAVAVIPEIDGCCITDIDELTWDVSVSKEAGLNGLFVGLNSLGIQVTSMRNESNRLEQLFMDLLSENRKGGEA